MRYRKELTSKHNYLLGSGSNTVFTEHFDGTVFINRLMGVKISSDDTYYHLSVNAGENWHQLVAICIEKGIYGFENLALIPGTVGAAPIQNIGAYGVEIKDFVVAVEYIDLSSGKTKTLSNTECKFAYRDSIFKSTLNGSVFISRVDFKLPKKNLIVSHYGPLATLQNPSAIDIYQQVIHTRTEKLPDPKTMGNAGSFFKNPIISRHNYEKLLETYPQCPSYFVNDDLVKIPAAWLIDTLGFKGGSVNQIYCHVQQPLVLINVGGGQGADLLTLARKIQRSVQQHFEIELENEVRLLGAQGPIVL